MAVRGVFLLVTLGLQADLVGAWGLLFDNCCSTGNPMGGTCEDGSVGPCCGVHECNAMCCGCDGGCRGPVDEADVIPISSPMRKVPLNQWPMLMSHDAATAYAVGDTCSPHTPVNNWAVTQARGGWSRLLGCGARAFDLRPYLKKSGELVMAHGSVVFDTEVKDAVEDVLNWSKQNPETFVLIMTSHIAVEEGDSHAGVVKTESVMSDLGVKKLGCEAIARMTLGTAMDLGQLSKGGSVLYTWGNCVEPYFDESITCYGQAAAALSKLQGQRLEGEEVDLAMDELRNDTAEGDARRLSLSSAGTCYGSDQERKQFFDPFWKYMDGKCNTPAPPFENRAWLWMAQAHWQYTTEAIAEGTARRGCILWDEQHSQMNLKVAEKIEQGHFKHLNLLEVDHTCNHGERLMKALHKHVLTKFKHHFEAEEKVELPKPGSTVGVHILGRAGLPLAGAASSLVLGALIFGALVLRRRVARRRRAPCGAAEEAARENLVGSDGADARDLAAA